MTGLKEKERQGDGDSKDEVTITFKNADGLRGEAKVKKGTRLSEFLGGVLKHKHQKGMMYQLGGGRMLDFDKETGELTEDPVLDTDLVLVIERNFTGGVIS